jgi:hypothetical protein
MLPDDNLTCLASVLDPISTLCIKNIAKVKSKSLILSVFSAESVPYTNKQFKERI